MSVSSVACCFEPQLPATPITPSRLAAPMFFSISGVPQLADGASTGTLPCPRPNSLSVCSSRRESEVAVVPSSTRSGRVRRRRWISGAASDSGTLKFSSITTFSFSRSNPPARSGAMLDWFTAVSSLMQAMVDGTLPVALAASAISGSSAAGMMEEDGGEVAIT